MSAVRVALAGNPNVGKSTVFNSFTGLHRHTGNWTGKTVDNAVGEYTFNGRKYSVADIPGTYSLKARSADEEAACDLILGGLYDVLVIVADAVCIERNLRFVCEVLEATSAPAVVCLNLSDEAEKKGIFTDKDKLSNSLGVPVIPTAARSGSGLFELKSAIESASELPHRKPRSYHDSGVIFKDCCTIDSERSDKTDRVIDRFVLSKSFGIPIMLILLLGIFWITIVGANYPSRLLSVMFAKISVMLRSALNFVGSPELMTSALIDGVFAGLSWVIAVMLPPMAIFFPLFTLLEDSGFLPRIAFNLDTCFRCSGAHGKQALTTSMGFGCNACAVVGCRIIDSPRERLIAIITNSMIPCNGRFPLLISVTAMFLCPLGGSLQKAAVLLAFVSLAVAVSLLASKLLSKTVLRGVPSSFVLELPPYRRPQLGKVIVRSVLDRTVFVLLRAAAVAAPAGLVLWLLANISVSGVPLIERFTSFLDPFACMLGLDGAILAAFILSFPANETVLPVTMMIYLSQQTLTELPDAPTLASTLSLHGWTPVTAVCVILFSMFHFPCSTTCLTICKETKSLRITLLAAVYPLMIGTLLCALVHLFSKLVAFV